MCRFVLSKFCNSGRYKILHTRQQLCCRGMCNSLKVMMTINRITEKILSNLTFDLKSLLQWIHARCGLQWSERFCVNMNHNASFSLTLKMHMPWHARDFMNSIPNMFLAKIYLLFVIINLLLFRCPESVIFILNCIRYFECLCQAVVTIT